MIKEQLYQIELPGEYMIVTTEKPYKCFVKFNDKKKPEFSRDMRLGMIFAYKNAAECIADELGNEYRVIGVSQKAIKAAEKLLAAIFEEEK